MEYINLVSRLSPRPDESSKYRCLIVLHSNRASWGSDCRNMELGSSFVGVRGEPGNEATNLCDSCMWHKFKNWQSNHNTIITMGNSVLLMCQTGFVTVRGEPGNLCDSCMWHKFKNWQSNHNTIITMGNSVLLMCQTGFVIATSSRHFLCD